MPSWLKLFMAGIMADTAIKSLFQDSVGKDAYLRMIDAGWASAWITVPIAVVILWSAWLWGKEGKAEFSRLYMRSLSEKWRPADTPERHALADIVAKLGDEQLSTLGREIRDTALRGLR